MTSVHSDSDLLSALQKFIRRGMDRDVLSVGNEMCNRAIPNYDVQRWARLWRRLHIIATEDIGVAQRGTHSYLARTHEEADAHFHSSSKDREKARSPCLAAILTLVPIAQEPPDGQRVHSLRAAPADVGQ